MKLPATPPDHDLLIREQWKSSVEETPDQVGGYLHCSSLAQPVDDKGRYFHWDDFRYKQPPEGMDIKTWWAWTRRARSMAAKPVLFRLKSGKQFSYVTTDFIARTLHEIDSEMHGGIKFSAAPPSDNETSRFLVRSLIEEPFNSSLLEGAATTREQAKKLIHENERPKTNDERMVVNNYRAIEFIKERKNDPLTTELIHELHRIITQGTLQDEEKAGAFRTSHDTINVVDEVTNEILHAPPSADTLALRMQNLCDFANNPNEHDFIHPILKAIILHFMLAYDHPYVDGNGRTARALFYWSVLKDNYWLLEYISISKIINKAPVKYGAAFLETETDAGDLTYFFNHQLTTISQSVNELQIFITAKQQEIKDFEIGLEKRRQQYNLNHRQLSLLHDAIKNPKTIYTIVGHERLYKISYLTARSDLNLLVKNGLLKVRTHSKKKLFTPAPRLAAKIGTLNKK